MNYIKSTHIFYATVITLCSLLNMGHSASAFTPEWQEEQGIDVSAFRYAVTVTAPSSTVPTVVEIPLSSTFPQNKSAVVMDSAGTFQTAYYKTYTEYTKVPVLIQEGDRNLPNLTDAQFDTTEDFPFAEGEKNMVSIAFSGNKNISITTSELHINLAPNVALPKTVTITANNNTVVSKTALHDSVVRFPEVTASRFVVEFELVQPLRLAEIEFIQKSDVVESEAIRFLTQPNEQYTLYVDPDRSFGYLSSGGVSLALNTDVLEMEKRELKTNREYVPSDSDADGIPDSNDNCVSEPNTDQLDVDRNGRGDVCDDFDRDGVMTTQDNCPSEPNWDQKDTDGDEMGDVCDTEENRLTERNPWIPWAGMGIAGFVLIGLLLLSIPKQGVEPAVRKEEDLSLNKESENQENNTHS